MSLRILHCVEFYSPSIGGAQEVVRQISERLVARGHSVTVATSRDPARRNACAEGVQIAEFDVSGNAARGMTGDVDAYRRYVAAGDFDVVMTYAAQQWTTDALLPMLDEIPYPKVMAPCGFSGLHHSDFADYFDQLPTQLRAFDALVFHSETYQDVRFTRAAGIDSITVIPNAADEREFGELPVPGGFRRAHGIGADAPLLLTVGGHTGLKGHAEAMAVLRRSKRADSGVLAIVGNTPTGQGCLTHCRVRAAATRAATPRRRVLLLDPPRDQVIAAYVDADLFVFCSAIECSPLVLFESMAAGLPFVSFDVGNAREIADWSGSGVAVATKRRRDGLVAGDPTEVAAVVDDLLADSERRSMLAERGRHVWQQRFSWDAAVNRYEDLYEKLAGTRE